MNNTVLALCTAALAACATPALAQYYAPPPPPPPGYYPPPPPPPRRDYYRPIGGRCQVFFRDPYGRGHSRICPISDPKPVGRPCACPGPGPGGYVGGQTVQ